MLDARSAISRHRSAISGARVGGGSAVRVGAGVDGRGTAASEVTDARANLKSDAGDPRGTLPSDAGDARAILNSEAGDARVILTSDAGDFGSGILGTLSESTSTCFVRSSR